jgi:hypothetical protein
MVPAVTILNLSFGPKKEEVLLAFPENRERIIQGYSVIEMSCGLEKKGNCSAKGFYRFF